MCNDERERDVMLGGVVCAVERAVSYGLEFLLIGDVAQC